MLQKKRSILSIFIASLLLALVFGVVLYSYVFRTIRPIPVMSQANLGQQVHVSINNALVIHDGNLRLLSIEPDGTFSIISELASHHPVRAIDYANTNNVFALYENDIVVVDYSNLHNPKLLNVVYQNQSIIQFFASEHYLFVSYGKANLGGETENTLYVDVLDIQNLEQPKLLHTLKDFGGSLSGQGKYLIGFNIPNSYASVSNAKLNILDISRETPSLMFEGDFFRSYLQLASAKIDFYDNKAYYTDGEKGVYIVDLQDKSPTLYAYYDQFAYLDLEVNDKYIVAKNGYYVSFLDQSTLRPIPFASIDMAPVFPHDIDLTSNGVLLILQNNILHSYKLD